MKFTIRIKLFGAFSLILALLVVTSAVSVNTMSSMGERSQEVDTHSIPSLTILSLINKDIANVDRMAMGMVLEPDASAKQTLKTKMELYLAEIKDSRSKFETFINSDLQQQLYADFANRWSQYEQALPTIIEAAEANNTGAANYHVTEAHPAYNGAVDRLEALERSVTDKVSQDSVQSIQTYETGRTFAITVSVAAVVLGLVIAIVIGTLIANPIKQMARQVKRVSGGDLTAEPVRVRTRDELRELAEDFQEMTVSLRTIVGQVQFNAEQVAATAEELSAGSELTSQTTDQIAASVQGVAVASEQQMEMTRDSYQAAADISTAMNGIATSVEKVNESSREATRTAKSGQEIITVTKGQMERIHQKVNVSADTMNIVGSKSEQIGDIIGLITSISNQTNLLALNAAIEAARAGEHGRGFSVVADEVRKLAEQSVQATEQIYNLITEMQADTARAIEAMRDGREAVGEGLLMMSDAGQSFADILGAVYAVSQQVEEVSAAVQQVHAGTSVMASSIEAVAHLSSQAAESTQSISTAIEETNASMQEITAAADMLAKMAEELQASIAAFKL